MSVDNRKDRNFSFQCVGHCWITKTSLSSFNLPSTEFAQITFNDVCIEDFWLKYYCVSTNLSTAHEMVHELGLMRNASYATGALPVVCKV
jgi:predicted acylesterase/phospholipase RssA